MNNKEMHNIGLVSAIMAEALKAKRKEGKLENSHSSHKKDIAYYAMMEYGLMRNRNPNLPKLRTLEDMGENDQFTFSKPEVEDSIHRELETLGCTFE